MPAKNILTPNAILYVVDFKLVAVLKPLYSKATIHTKKHIANKLKNNRPAYSTGEKFVATVLAEAALCSIVFKRPFILPRVSKYWGCAL